MAPALALQYPEGNEATEDGQSVDRQITAAIRTGEATTPISQAALAWVRRLFGGDTELHVQRKVQLTHAWTGALITEGTPDLFGMVGNRLIVVDWKAEGQVFQGYVPPPDENLQLLTYAVAAALELGAEELQVIVAPFGDDELGTPIEGRVWPSDQWDSVIEQVVAIQERANLPPVATTGRHCRACWQKKHCPAFILPAHEGPETALAPFTVPGALADPVRAVRVLEQFEKASKIAIETAWERIEAHVRQHGPIRDGNEELAIIPTKGRQSGASVAELKAAGLTNMIKQGKPGEKLDWRKVAQP